MKQVSPRVPAGNYPVAHIAYELNVLGSRYENVLELMLKIITEALRHLFFFGRFRVWQRLIIIQLLVTIVIFFIENTNILIILIRGPRRMQCVMDSIPARAVEPGGVAPTQTEFVASNLDSIPSLPFFRSKSGRGESVQSGLQSGQNEGMLVLRNKAPRWHEQLQCWCLNFNGRVTVASVKNFQLVASPENGVAAGPEHENVILQFGKVGKDVFTMDYQYPISAFQAFAICLSSFDTKIACE